MNCNLGTHPLHGTHKANAVMRARGGGCLHYSSFIIILLGGGRILPTLQYGCSGRLE